MYDDLPDREMWGLYLRLRMLSTFVHEVAHHYDYLVRLGRGRWLADSTDKNEIHAERLEHEWTQQCVVPYLEETYPVQLCALLAWTEHHGGIELPLARLAGDPRATAKGGLVNIAKGVFGIQVAFDSLVEDVFEGVGLVASRLGFARNLHYGEHYDDALQIIDGVLASQPDHLEALTLRGDVFVHQGKCDQARILAEAVIAIDPANSDAWSVLADAMEGQQDWNGLLAAATRLIELAEGVRWQRRSALAHRARARLELGDNVGLQEDLDELTTFRSRWTDELVSELRAEMVARQSTTAVTDSP